MSYFEIQKKLLEIQNRHTDLEGVGRSHHIRNLHDDVAELARIMQTMIANDPSMASNISASSAVKTMKIEGTPRRITEANPPPRVPSPFPTQTLPLKPKSFSTKLADAIFGKR